MSDNSPNLTLDKAVAQKVSSENIIHSIQRASESIFHSFLIYCETSPVESTIQRKVESSEKYT